MLPQIGERGQELLAKAKVLIVGVGGLGSPLSMYLTGAGVGTIGIMDDDVVSESNLHRQVLYTQEQVGLSKVECAASRLKAMNPQVQIISYSCRLSGDNAREIISQYDMVLDGSDNFQTRYVIDSVCAEFNKPYVFGAICGFSGQVCVFNYKKGFRYVDLFPQNESQEESLEKSQEKSLEKSQKESLEESLDMSKSVVGMTASLTASVQAMEALKIICSGENVTSGFGNDILDGILWTYDLLKNEANRYNFA